MSETVRKDKELITTRVFEAPRELVFDAWMDPEHLTNWFGPEGFTITTKRWSAQPGGEWEFTMHDPDGTDYANLIRFIKIDRPELIEYLQMEDESTKDDAFHVVVSFSEVDGKTKLVMHMRFRDKEYLDHVINEYGALEGQKQTFDRLTEYLLTLQ